MKITTFDEARKFLSNLPNVNYGGCGIVALSMYRWIMKNEKENPNMILLYRPSNEETGSLRKGPTHCGVEYKGKIIDGNEEIPLDLYSTQITISEKGMLNLINSMDNWNEDFERKKHVPIMGEKLGIDLSDVCLKAD
jgi:hypothetical protein